MKAPARALLYGLGVWGSLVGISLVLLPVEGRSQALYESVKLTGLVGAGLGFSIRYLLRHPALPVRAGALVGLVWAVLCVGLDLCLYAAGAFTIGLGAYFADVASSYLVLPVVSALTIGLLARRAPGAGPDTSEPSRARSILERA